MLNSRPAGGMHLSNARHSGCFFGARHFGRSKATCLAATKQSSGSKSATKLSKNGEWCVEWHACAEEKRQPPPQMSRRRTGFLMRPSSP
eukprot:1161341-Pelagomonas_calceolata.AAC.5